MKFSKSEIAEKVEQARIFSLSKSQRWSAVRTRVIEALLQQSRPCTAYELLNVMNSGSARPLMPASVYRILDSFCTLGIAFRIDSTKCFFANRKLEEGIPDFLMICSKCGSIDGLKDQELCKNLQKTGVNNGFKINQQILELHGNCNTCTHKEA